MYVGADTGTYLAGAKTHPSLEPDVSMRACIDALATNDGDREAADRLGCVCDCGRVVDGLGTRADCCKRRLTTPWRKPHLQAHHRNPWVVAGADERKEERENKQETIEEEEKIDTVV
ncbi:hypothetical protein PMIN06_007826 [Paraphaeosphaeria minitans]